MYLKTRCQAVLMVAYVGSWCVVGSATGEEAAKPARQVHDEARAFGLSVSEMHIGVESDYEWRRVHSSFPGRRDSDHENRDLQLRELFGLTLEGDVYDPNLLEYRAALEFGLTQDRFVEEIDGRRDTDRDTGWLGEYDISIDAFKTKPVSLHAYARRFDDRVSRRFLPSLREEQTETGISLLAIHGPHTTEMGFSWDEVDRTGNRLDEDDEHLETSSFYLDHKWEISENQRLRVFYEHARQQNSYQGSVYDYDTRRDLLRVEHELLFGPQGKHRLDTYLRYNEEQGDLARDEIELVPRLSLQHTDRFQTAYRYGLYRYEQDAIEVNQHKFDVQALYQASDHLRLSVDGFGLYERVDTDVETFESGGGFDVSYRRPGSLGELSANLAVAYDRSRTHGDAGQRLIRGEAHQLHDVRPVYLIERYVIRGSIRAHNADRTRYYVEGLDYVVVMLEGRALILRVPTGRIAEEEVVYFDYTCRVPANATADTYRTDLLIEHRFKLGLRPYYTYEGRCEEVEASLGTPLDRDNTHRHRFGLAYERDRWSAGGEYEIFDDSVLPYDAFHLTGRYGVIRSAAHSLDVSAELSRYLFDSDFDDRRVWWFDVDLTDRVALNRWLWVVAQAAYRWEDDSVDGETNGVDVEVGLQFNRGYLTVDLTVEYDLLSIADSRDDGFGVFLNVRRDLSHLLSSRGSKR